MASCSVVDSCKVVASDGVAVASMNVVDHQVDSFYFVEDDMNLVWLVASNVDQIVGFLASFVYSMVQNQSA